MGAAADCYLGLYKRSNGFELEAEGRDIEELSKSISRDRECCLWTVSMDAKEQSRHSLEMRILQLLEEGPTGKADLKRRLWSNGDKGVLNDALAQLEKVGKACCREERTDGRPREVWELS